MEFLETSDKIINRAYSKRLLLFKGNEFGGGNSNDTRGLGDVQHHQIASDYKQAPLPSEHREKYYGTTRKSITGQQSPTNPALERIPEYSEDIYPYATFHLPDEENLTGNPIMMTRYGSTNNAGTLPISANLYNSKNSISSIKEVQTMQ